MTLRLLSIIHATAPSGIHSFWNTRWKGLIDLNIEVHFIVRPGLNHVLDGVPSSFIHEAKIHSPQGGKIGFLRYLVSIPSDRMIIKEIGRNLNVDATVSHGVQSLAESTILNLPNYLFLHGNSLAKSVYLIRRFFPRPKATFSELEMLAYPKISRREVYNFRLLPGITLTGIKRQYIGGNSSSKPLLLWVGNSSHNKNAREYCRNASLLQRMNQLGVQGVMIFGDKIGNVTEENSSISDGLMISNLQALGKVNNLWDTYKCASRRIFLSTSLKEGIANVIMEAAVNGFTIIARNNEGAREAKKRIQSYSQIPVDRFFSIYDSQEQIEIHLEKHLKLKHEEISIFTECSIAAFDIAIAIKRLKEDLSRVESSDKQL